MILRMQFSQRIKLLLAKKTNIYLYFYGFFVIFLGILFIRRRIFSDLDDFDEGFFFTAKGKISIEEITKNVFEKSGYSLAKNDLVPLLKKFNPQTCQEVFSEWQKVADAGLTINPPSEIPDLDAFLMNGYAGVEYKYYRNIPRNRNASIPTWDQAKIDGLIEFAKTNASAMPGSYPVESVSVFEATKRFVITEQVGAVIGSLNPWVEPFLLANGAKHVTTVDYQKVYIEHPLMDFLYALDLVAQSEKYYDKFDFIVSFSSIEHSGLGRYGDPIDPIGDIREINKIRCMLKPNGLLFLGFAVGPDAILFNAHRVYGRIRLAMMFEGFRMLKVYYGDQEVSEDKLKYIFNHKANHDQYLFVLQKL